LDWIVVNAQLTVTEVTLPAGLTFTVVIADLVLSCTDVAVTMIWLFTGTFGAVTTPELDTEPELTVQVTVGSKLPVPLTVAVH
jgi:hypothetical protein